MTNKMTQKFIDLLGPITDENPSFGIAGLHPLNKLTDEKKQQVEQIVKENFLVSKVLWMELPAGMSEDGKEAIIAKTYKIVDEDYETYEGKTMYLYQIMFSPKMYNPEILHTPVKDGCVFGPLLYDPETFYPTRQVVLTFKPTSPQGINNPDDYEEVMRQSLRDKLEQVLANPDDYLPEAYRACMIRMAIK